MKYSLVLLCLIITSCTKNHKIINAEIISNRSDINNQIRLCLDNEIGYGSYELKFQILLNDGTEIDEIAVIYGHVDNRKKCFDLFLGAEFIGKGDSNEYKDLISNIYKNNVSSMTIEVYDSGNLISTSNFEDL